MRSTQRVKSFAIPLPLHTSSLSGFYYPDVMAEDKYYNGSILEEEYEKKLMVRGGLMD